MARIYGGLHIEVVDPASVLTVSPLRDDELGRLVVKLGDSWSPVGVALIGTLDELVAFAHRLDLSVRDFAQEVQGGDA